MEVSEPKITPAQKQYNDLKSQHQDALLLFRMGDFYEFFGEDAIIASKVLGLTLTSRDRKSENRTPMAGVPHHSVNKYIIQLAKKGYKIAIAEQMSDASAPGIVERKVIRVITPGTIFEEEMLESKKNNFIACVIEKNTTFGLAFLDSSTGDFFFIECSDIKKLTDELFKMQPAEVIFTKKYFISTDIIENFKQSGAFALTFFEMPEDPKNVLLHFFQVQTLKGFGVEEFSIACMAGGYLLRYVQEHEKIENSHIKPPKAIFQNNYMHLDETTIRNLEIVSNNYNFQKEGSLLSILDKTITPMGGRLLRQWLIRPLQSKEAILKRLECTSVFLKQYMAFEKLHTLFSEISDIERILTKCMALKYQPRDFLALKNTIIAGHEIKHMIEPFCSSEMLKNCISDISLPELQKIFALIEESVSTDESEEGRRIKSGYNEEIDTLRDLVFEGKDWLLKYEKEEQARTGISNLKVRFNSVFGYYIEISKGQLTKIPDTYIRKQTLVNAERFMTPELKMYEEKVLHAEEQLFAQEREILESIARSIIKYTLPLQRLALSIAQLDVFHSFSACAHEYHYTCPEFTDDTPQMKIIGGRHPVVEHFLSSPFVANDLILDQDKNVMLLTGPNMAGKSTYLRQNALIILLAHIGSFVPAEHCSLTIVDRIFTRIGASDMLIKGESTFLVEMQETANILQNATSQSFIIFDEIGRGTSTYDGVALAQSVLEYVHDIVKAKVLFATHYHELITIADQLAYAKNCSMSVLEQESGVVFLRKVVEQPVDKSYGIEVARISGLPKEVIERAKDLLPHLESLPHGNKTIAEEQMSFIQPQVIEKIKYMEKSSQVEEQIRGLAVEDMTPRDALNTLFDIKQKLKDKNA